MVILHIGVEMKTITLTRGFEALVDDGDYEWLSNHKWHVQQGKYTTYAVTKINGYVERMHRLILGIIGKHEFEGDHIDFDGLNNTRGNLRIATSQQNNFNRRKRANYSGEPCSSRFKGVSFNKEKNKWTARARLNGNLTHLGYFKAEEDAAIAYNEFAIKHHGEFALLNNPTYGTQEKKGLRC